ncbi:hypothetical protein [Bacillus wiedmannii]|uniref:hypothetical protein n=1 Tax=Bacillus wiedmannii TaxID=1890302 RepID=UPI000BF21920|nr:hypothetical protein [Bacillus wiedmannii]PEL63276.1 hypothetical protein CN622_10945 [Bacillus wiedmannii]
MGCEHNWKGIRYGDTNQLCYRCLLKQSRAVKNKEIQVCMKCSSIWEMNGKAKDGVLCEVCKYSVNPDIQSKINTMALHSVNNTI